MLSKEYIKNNLEKVYSEKGYKFFKGELSVNVFGIRCQTGTNNWDDIIGVSWYENGELQLLTFDATTDPGTHWLKNPMRKSGCAIMVEGQYRGAYMVGPHGRSRYEACRQAKPIPVYRDNNKDSNHDLNPDTIEKGLFYTNIHHGWSSKYVNKNSAGCMVIKSKAKFEKQFMPIIKKSCKKYGKHFTFTLLNIKDFS